MVDDYVPLLPYGIVRKRTGSAWNFEPGVIDRPLYEQLTADLAHGRGFEVRNASVADWHIAPRALVAHVKSEGWAEWQDEFLRRGPTRLQVIQGVHFRILDAIREYETGGHAW